MGAQMDGSDRAQLGAVALVGLPGAGKSSLAARLLAQLPLRLVDRDAIRAAMFPAGGNTLLQKRAAFRAVVAAAEVNAAAGQTSLVDGMPFSRREDYARLQRAMDGFGRSTMALWLDCPLQLAQARVEADRASGRHPADDRSADLVEEVAMRFSPPPDAVRLDASLALDQLEVEAVAAVLRRLRLA